MLDSTFGCCVQVYTYNSYQDNSLATYLRIYEADVGRCVGPFSCLSISLECFHRLLHSCVGGRMGGCAVRKTMYVRKFPLWYSVRNVPYVKINLKASASHFVELRPLTDDNTQLRILATPTFAFALSQQVVTGFDYSRTSHAKIIGTSDA
jgi:hypothetical protein